MLDPARIPGAVARLIESCPATSLETDVDREVTIWVAYSGGLDSHVLLHALVNTGVARLRAVHIDHGLHPDSADWAAHCARVCTELGVTLVTRRVDAAPGPGESPEAAARHARHAVFEACLEAGDCLLSAHHRDDQMETVLLQMLRGAGPSGLAAMPARARLGGGWLLRPLLGFERVDLAEYAHRYGLHWLDDPSNADTRFDRNFLRREIVPRLKSRWPAATRTVARSARLVAAAAESVREQAVRDLAEARTPGSDGDAEALLIAVLQAQGWRRAAEVLRLWLAQPDVPAPTEDRLGRIWREVVAARADAEPSVEIGEIRVRRFRGRLYRVPRWPAPDPWTIAWPDPGVPLVLPFGLGMLRWTGSAPSSALRAHSRQGGERVAPGPSRPRRALKDVLRESAIPPWRRARMPLVSDASGLVVGVPGVTPGLAWLVGAEDGQALSGDPP